TVSAADGSYQFENLRAGEYTLVELQPTGWLDGRDVAGTIAGKVVGSAENPGDRIRQVAINWGQDGIQYNFGELLAGSIAGFVYADMNQNCTFDAGESPIGGVKVELLDAQGNVIATTQTNAQGEYKFEN